ncbi:hypothetical protein [Piscinibacter sakaiensis]|uniref:hypothetical protein n=1 Tax=Piscinibacter sakaiensis TaxID=1547922 RepID=UPI003AAAC299
MPLIDNALQYMADFITRYAVTLAGLGILTMAILEAVKKLCKLRQIFQRNALEAWLGQSESGRQAAPLYSPHGPQAGEPAHYNWRKAHAELMWLCTGVQADRQRQNSGGGRVAFHRSVEFALFELELPKMMGQIQEAADAALNAPDRFPHWFAFLARGCNPEDVERWRTGIAAGSQSSDAQRKDLAELYGRIRLLVKRQLDAFQTITAYRWREWNQLYSWWLGAVLMFIAQIIASNTGGAKIENWAIVIGISLLGGLLAPVAKDLVDALSKLKK